MEQNGTEYTQVGDFLIPNLTLPAEEQHPIGIWGQRHLRYIKQEKKGLHIELKATGKLNSYLAETDREAKDLFSRIVKELAEKEGITEQLKASEQMKWTALMNNIRERAMEIVNHQIIFA